MHRIFSLVLALILLACPVFAADGEGESVIDSGSVSSGSGGSGADPAGEGFEALPIVDEEAAAAAFPDSVSVEALTVAADELTVAADTVLMSVPEDNVYPAGAPLAGGVYMQVDTVQLGEVIIYVPVSAQYKSFTTTTDGRPVNITGSTITGYSFASQDYSIRWTSFGQAQYRPVDNSYTWDDLDIDSVLNTNIVLIDGPEDLPVVPDADMLSLMLIFMVGVIVLVLFMKR